jgi:Asp-tRNA(Asn)/Glu-tRNA(Gln) amidotransferase A subunit family amidase
MRLLVAVGFAIVICLSQLPAGAAAPNQAGTPPPQSPFPVVEATVAGIEAALASGQLTCHALVQAYLDRIDAFDKRGPAINAIVQINPNALAEADALDAKQRAGGPVGALHCIPTIVKDNFETIGLQSASGSLSLKGFVSNKDAFRVKRMKDAGAIVLAKSNMAEFAFSPVETVGSILPGYTHNPYALDRSTAGSSGGTAAAVAANFGAVGLGSDTGNSIRGPSSHQSLVGIRSTMGLTSRSGVSPLNLLADIAGPITRTVADAAAVFQVVAGEDPDDAVTARSRGREIPNYLAALKTDGLKGARLGILRAAYERNSADPEILAVFGDAQKELIAAGATIVDQVTIERVARPQGAGSCGGFKYDINRYLAGLGDLVPVHSLDEIVRSNQFHPSIQTRLQGALTGSENGPDSPACQADAAYRAAYGAAITKAMDDQQLDALIYPTWSNVPRLIGDLNTPGGDNSQVHSPTSGFPAINVPMGFTRDNTLPIGLSMLGRAWSEATLFRLAYAYEQATHHRHPPASTPPLPVSKGK